MVKPFGFALPGVPVVLFCFPSPSLLRADLCPDGFVGLLGARVLGSPRPPGGVWGCWGGWCNVGAAARRGR